MALFVKYTVMGSVVLLMLGVGLRTSFGEVIGVARQFRLVMRGLLANFLVVPVLIYLSILWLGIPPNLDHLTRVLNSPTLPIDRLISLTNVLPPSSE